MGRKLVKRTAEYRIYQRKDDRYAVTDPNKKPINGDDKVAILLAEGLVSAPAPKQPAPEPTEDAPAEEGAEVTDEAADGAADAE